MKLHGILLLHTVQIHPTFPSATQDIYADTFLLERVDELGLADKDLPGSPYRLHPTLSAKLVLLLYHVSMPRLEDCDRLPVM